LQRTYYHFWNLLIFAKLKKNMAFQPIAVLLLSSAISPFFKAISDPNPFTSSENALDSYFIMSDIALIYESYLLIRYTCRDL